MARVKRGVTARARHKKILKAAKGYYGARSRVFRVAKQAVIKAGQYAFRDRRVKKREFRALWTQRINAAAREQRRRHPVAQGLDAGIARGSDYAPIGERRVRQKLAKQVGHDRALFWRDTVQAINEYRGMASGRERETSYRARRSGKEKRLTNSRRHPSSNGSCNAQGERAPRGGNYW